jgi:hypothetical protein
MPHVAVNKKLFFHTLDKKFERSTFFFLSVVAPKLHIENFMCAVRNLLAHAVENLMHSRPAYVATRVSRLGVSGNKRWPVPKKMCSAHGVTRKVNS